MSEVEGIHVWLLISDIRHWKWRKRPAPIKEADRYNLHVNQKTHTTFSLVKATLKSVSYSLAESWKKYTLANGPRHMKLLSSALMAMN